MSKEFGNLWGKCGIGVFGLIFFFVQILYISQLSLTNYNLIFICLMLSVQPPIQMGRHQMSLDSNISHQAYEAPLSHKSKQQQKKQLITPAKVLIGIAIFCILAIASYKVYTIAFPAKTDSKLQINQGKIIQNVESSSGKGQTSSSSGSQSSRGKDSTRPIGVAKPAGKDVISSNLGGDGDGDQDPSQQDNDGHKRNKLINKNKNDGSSTQEDSDESASEEESEPNEGQIAAWPNNGGANTIPLVGSTRT